MAGPIELDVLDAPLLGETNFGDNMQMWITNIVDIINSSFDTLNQAFANLITAQSVDIGGGGAGPITVSVPGLTPSGFIYANLLSSTVPVSITNVTPITNGFTITFSADPTVSAIIMYQAYTAQPP